MSAFQIREFVEQLKRKVFPTNFRPSLYVVHPSEKLFIRHFRQDVTATDAPKTASGVFIIMEFDVQKSQVVIIKGFAPYAMERTNADGLTESARYIDPKDGNDWLTFTPIAAGAAPFLIETNLNAPQNIGGATLSDLTFRQTSSGIAQISLTPYRDAIESFQNPFFSMEVPSNKKFQALFQLSGPAAATDAILNPYVIGNPPVPGTKRVDFAGVFVAGVVLSETAYREAVEQFEK